MRQLMKIFRFIARLKFVNRIDGTVMSSISNNDHGFLF